MARSSRPGKDSAIGITLLGKNDGLWSSSNGVNPEAAEVLLGGENLVGH